MLILVVIKVVWFCLDHALRLYMGDSMTYLHTAVNLTGTGGRSFVYGWLLRGFALPFGVPEAVVGVQALWSLLTCLALFTFLRLSLGLGFLAAAFPSWLLATEPAQVFLERMLMAETIGLLALVSTLLVFSRYLATGDLRWFLLGALGGLAATAFRTNFLPVAIGLALVALVLHAWFSRKRDPARALALHVSIAVAMLATSHFAYMHLYGRVTNSTPGYLAYTGMMRIGLVAPLIKPNHFDGTGVSGEVLSRVGRPLEDHWQRGHHIWEEDGLWQALQRETASAEEVARTITGRAMRDNPVGLLRINLETLGGYFDASRRHWRMLDDLGTIPPSPEDLRQIRAWTGWDMRGRHELESPAQRLFANSGWWLTACLFVLPVLSVLTIVLGLRHPRSAQFLLLGLASAGMFASHLLFSHIVSFRYIHPLPWFVFANLAAIMALMTARCQAATPPRSAPGAASSSMP